MSKSKYNVVGCLYNGVLKTNAVKVFVTNEDDLDKLMKEFKSLYGNDCSCKYQITDKSNILMEQLLEKHKKTINGHNILGVLHSAVIKDLEELSGEKLRIYLTNDDISSHPVETVKSKHKKELSDEAKPKAKPKGKSKKVESDDEVKTKSKSKKVDSDDEAKPKSKSKKVDSDDEAKHKAKPKSKSKKVDSDEDDKPKKKPPSKKPGTKPAKVNKIEDSDSDVPQQVGGAKMKSLSDSNSDSSVSDTD